MIKNKDVVIYHANCTDGTMAAAVYHYFFDIANNAIVYEPGKHGVVNTDFENCNIFFLDFSYNAEATNLLLKKGNTVTVIDHHKSAILELADVKCKKYLCTDNSKSGAYLAWEYFSNLEEPSKKEYKVPAIIKMISDRDTWNWNKADLTTVYTLAYLDSLPCEVEEYSDILFNEGLFPVWYEEAYTAGKAVLGYCQKNIKRLVEREVEYINFYGYENVAIINCGGEYSSEVGNYLLANTNAAFVVAYQILPKGIKYSLRSTNNRVDVSLVAKEINATGGGHRNAAGVFVPNFKVVHQYT